MDTPQVISENLKQWPDAPEEITILKARVNELEKMLEKAKREKIILKIVLMVLVILWWLLS